MQHFIYWFFSVLIHSEENNQDAENAICKNLWHRSEVNSQNFLRDFDITSFENALFNKKHIYKKQEETLRQLCVTGCSGFLKHVMINIYIFSCLVEALTKHEQM